MSLLDWDRVAPGDIVHVRHTQVVRDKQQDRAREEFGTYPDSPRWDGVFCKVVDADKLSGGMALILEREGSGAVIPVLEEEVRSRGSLYKYESTPFKDTIPVRHGKCPSCDQLLRPGSGGCRCGFTRELDPQGNLIPTEAEQLDDAWRKVLERMRSPDLGLTPEIVNEALDQLNEEDQVELKCQMCQMTFNPDDPIEVDHEVICGACSRAKS